MVLFKKFSRLIGLGCFTTMWSTSMAAQGLPPPHPFLADSPWPISHGSTYNQDSSPLPGPTYNDLSGQTRVSTFDSNPVSVSLPVSGTYPDGARLVWGNTKGEVFKSVFSPAGMKVVGRRQRTTPASTEITGAYALIDRDNRYIVPRDLDLDIFFDLEPGNPRSAIGSQEIRLSSVLPQRRNGEHIVGFSMTYDGYLVFATSGARLGVLSREGELKDAIFLESPGADVSNSIAVDEHGGIYVVTSRRMQRIDWDGALLTPNWSIDYVSENFFAPGRLGTGSGTSPTLMGSAPEDDRFVVITDGRNRMHILLLWRDEIPADWAGLPGHDRRVAADQEVTFGKSSRDQAITEQSVAVWGYGAVVVDNSYGYIGALAQGIARRRFGQDLSRATIYLSNTRGVAPYGVEKFAWNPATRTLERSWSRPDISCPNGIPVISGAANLFYCVGQRREVWNIEALDFMTGRSRYYVPFSKSDFYNSFYAGLEVLPYRGLATGTFGGGFMVSPGE